MSPWARELLQLSIFELDCWAFESLITRTFEHLSPWTVEPRASERWAVGPLHLWTFECVCSHCGCHGHEGDCIPVLPNNGRTRFFSECDISRSELGQESKTRHGASCIYIYIYMRRIDG
jgi:hypothetical protein